MAGAANTDIHTAWIDDAELAGVFLEGCGMDGEGKEGSEEEENGESHDRCDGVWLGKNLMGTREIGDQLLGQGEMRTAKEMDTDRSSARN